MQLARRRRPRLQPARLAVGGGLRHRRGAVLPGVQPDHAGPRSSTRTAPTSGAGCPSCADVDRAARARPHPTAAGTRPDRRPRGGAPRGAGPLREDQSDDDDLLIVPGPLLRAAVVRQRRLDRRRARRARRTAAPTTTPRRGRRSRSRCAGRRRSTPRCRSRRGPTASTTAADDGGAGRRGAAAPSEPLDRRSSRSPPPTARAAMRVVPRAGHATRSRPASPAAPTAPRATGCGSSPARSTTSDGATRVAAAWTPAPERRARTGTPTTTSTARASLAGHLGRARLRRRLGRRPRATG